MTPTGPSCRRHARQRSSNIAGLPTEGLQAASAGHVCHSYGSGGAFEMTRGTQSEPLVAPTLGIWQRPIPAAMVALVIAGVASLAGWTSVRPDVVPADLIRFAIMLPENVPLRTLGLPRDLAISPDGTRIVYNAAVPGGVRQLHLRSIDQLDGAPLRGGEGLGPFFSPDGEWVGFVDRSLTTLQKVLISGGPAVMLAESSSPILGASWGGGRSDPVRRGERWPLQCVWRWRGTATSHNAGRRHGRGVPRIAVRSSGP